MGGVRMSDMGHERDGWKPFATGQGTRWKKQCQVCGQYRAMAHMIDRWCGRCRRFGRVQGALFTQDCGVLMIGEVGARGDQ